MDRQSLIDSVNDVPASIIVSDAFRRARESRPSWAGPKSSDLVVGIDFGTTFTSVAYAHSLSADDLTNASESKGALDRIVDKVILVKNWPMASFSEKTATRLSYNESGAMTAWGGRVRPTHPRAIQYFKLGLQENAAQHYNFSTVQSDSNSHVHNVASLVGGFLDNHDWRHPELTGKTALDYTADFLGAVRHHIFEVVLPWQLTSEFLKKERISFAITVPAIWTDKGKDLTKQAAERAGIPSNNLLITTEPEAAALYCATTCPVNVSESECFLICDAGGGTVVHPLARVY
jgi:molecular chaperone DnaK (HSP70)